MDVNHVGTIAPVFTTHSPILPAVEMGMRLRAAPVSGEISGGIA